MTRSTRLFGAVRALGVVADVDRKWRERDRGGVWAGSGGVHKSFGRSLDAGRAT